MIIEPKQVPPWRDFNFAEETQNRRVWMLVPKCASTSIRRSIPTLVQVKREHVNKYKYRVGVIRHPVFRIISAHNYGWPEIPIREWWEHVLYNPSWDIHTTPYAEILEPEVNIYLCVEDIVSWWRRWSPYKLQHHNSSQPSSIANMNIWLGLAPEIRDVYADDMRMWEETKKSFAYHQRRGEYTRGY